MPPPPLPPLLLLLLLLASPLLLWPAEPALLRPLLPVEGPSRAAATTPAPWLLASPPLLLAALGPESMELLPLPLPLLAMEAAEPSLALGPGRVAAALGRE